MKQEKDSEYLKDLLLKYTLWLDKRGAFDEMLCIDWKHQIETFLNQFYKDE